MVVNVVDAAQALCVEHLMLGFYFVLPVNAAPGEWKTVGAR
jgi:hypothetical protein